VDFASEIALNNVSLAAQKVGQSEKGLL